MNRRETLCGAGAVVLTGCIGSTSSETTPARRLGGPTPLILLTNTTADSQEVSVRISDDGTVVESRTVSIAVETPVGRTQFPVELTAEGSYDVTARAEDADSHTTWRPGEWNTLSITVEDSGIRFSRSDSY